MSTLNVALQDGFVDDAVIVRVNGDEAFRDDDVSTRFQISLATSFEVEVDEPGEATVDVELPDRDLRGRTTLDPAAQPHLGISVLDGELRFHASATPFGYL